VRVTSSETGELEFDISDDPYDIKRLDVTKAPIVVTLNKVRKYVIVCLYR
jgi:exosome complex component RRP42